MSSSTAKTSAQKQRQKLLAELTDLTLGTSGGAYASQLRTELQDILEHHSFLDVHRGSTAWQQANLEELWTRHSQQQKARGFCELSHSLHGMLGHDDDKHASIVALLLASAGQPLSSSWDPAAAQAALAQCQAADSSDVEPAPPSSSSSSDADSLDEAYDAAWDDSDDLSDWGCDDAQDRRRPPAHEVDPLIADDDLTASCENRQEADACLPDPQDLAGQCLAYPELPLPYHEPEQYEERLDPKDVTAKLLEARQLKLMLPTVVAYSGHRLAQQCLELLLGRVGKPFEASSKAGAHTLSLPSCQHSHRFCMAQDFVVHALTGTAARAVVAPFVAAANRRWALSQWTAAATHTCGLGWTPSTFPDGLVAGRTLNPTISACLVATGQQLDLVDAAVHSVQTWLSASSAESHGAGLLLWTQTQCRPIFHRLHLLETVLQRVLDAAMAAAAANAPRAAAKQHKRAACVDPTAVRDEHAAERVRACAVTRAVVDTLHDMLLETDDRPGRRGLVTRSMLLAILMAALRPTLDAFETLLREGSLDHPYVHSCLVHNSQTCAGDAHFWRASCGLAKTGGGEPLVPRCMTQCTHALVAACKASALLRADGQNLQHDSGDGHCGKTLHDKMMCAFDDVMLSHAPGHADQQRQQQQSAAEGDPEGPELVTELMRVAGALLADMHREEQSAADALLDAVVTLEDLAELPGLGVPGHRMHSLESDAAPPIGTTGDSGGGVIGRLSESGTLLQLERLVLQDEENKGRNVPEGFTSRTPSPDVRVVGTPAQREVSVAEKVSWMHASQLAAGLEGRYPSQSLEVESVRGSLGHLLHHQPARISHPSSVSADPSTRDGLAQAASRDSSFVGPSVSEAGAGASVHSLAALPEAAQRQMQSAAADGEGSGWGTDSSSDFSYGSSSGDESDASAREARRALRAARKELQRTRRARRRSSATQQERAAVTHQNAEPARGERLSIVDRGGVEGASGESNVLPRLRVRSEWERFDASLASAAASQTPLPAVASDSQAVAPTWARDAFAKRDTAVSGVQRGRRTFEYLSRVTRPAAINTFLPGCLGMPAYLPVQGVSSVAEHMAIALASDDAAARPQLPVARDGVHWQLQAVQPRLQPTRTLLQRCICDQAIERSFATRHAVSRLLMEECGLQQELQYVRGIYLMAYPAMHAWAAGVCDRLQRPGAMMTEDLVNEFHHSLVSHLDTARTYKMPAPEALRLSVHTAIGSSAVHRGLAAASSDTARASRVSVITHLDVFYTPAWPLNVLLSTDALARYRAFLPVLLQLHWAAASLSRTSANVCRSARRLRVPHGSGRPHTGRGQAGSVTPAPTLSTETATSALRMMRHAVHAFQSVMVHAAVGTAWQRFMQKLHDLSAARSDPADLHGRGPGDVDHIIVLHDEYLDEVEAAMWLSNDGTCKVLASGLHQLLELALQFCLAADVALGGDDAFAATPSGSSTSGTGSSAQDAVLARGRLRAAAKRATQAAARFRQELDQLAVLLCHKQLKVVAGSTARTVLDILNFNGHFNEVVAKC